MDGFGLPGPVLLAPLALVVAGILAFGRLWPSRRALIALIWAVLGWYLAWRIGDTVPWSGTPAALGWALLCLGVELAALFDAFALHLALARPTDRTPEADAHAARLAATDPAELPAVDVFIATYNEPREVLEKTIVGALALDWPDARVWVLDDGRRAWLRDFCRAKGAGWITRPDNRGAKAGNINHGLTLTTAPLVAVFDADFVPRTDFLMRTVGFFEDPRIGIVQVPHSFYNHDPMQANLGLRRAMPDDQRFFFETIMPGRDGWDAAFCCGSNSVTRRALFDGIGGGLPHGSITEDMLLTLAGLRAGFVTRYLNEPLALGLAPESVAAFFVQRERWAQGAMQILHLKEGPLGPGLRLVHRLLFLPSHYLTQSLMLIFSVVTPIVFLLTGLPPLTGVTLEGVVMRLLPMVLAATAGIAALAPGRYYPVAAQVLGLFASFRILPVAVQTLLRPHGLPFKVTPKGSDAGGGWESGVFWTALALAALTMAGLLANARPDTRIVEQVALVPMVAFWCGFNIVMLLLVAMLCLQRPARRGEERFPLAEPAVVRAPDRIDVTIAGGDLSLSGFGGPAAGFSPGARVEVRIAGVGWLPGTVARVAPARRGLPRLGIAFTDVAPELRDRLIVKLYATARPAAPRPGVLGATLALLARLWTADMRAEASPPAAPEPAPEKLPAATRCEPPAPSAAARARRSRPGASLGPRPAPPGAHSPSRRQAP